MKLLLFGSTGMLGNYLKNYLDKYYDIVCITRDIYDIENDNDHKLQSVINQYITNDNIIIINAAGIIPQRHNNDINKYIKVNTLFPHKIQYIIKDKNIPFIHITTDCVFSGTIGNYNEISDKDSKTLYGISKLLGEPNDACIIRTSIIGLENNNKSSLLEWIISNKNNTINGYVNHIWNGITCLTLSKIIKYMIDNNIYWLGVKHIYSPNSVTKYELCNIINNIFNLNIIINKMNTDKCDRTLSSINPIDYIINDIHSQIEELYKYHFNN
jgi:dTDP-4-dehydrorhamnose reductase